MKGDAMVEVIEVDRRALGEYARIPMWFEVTSVFNVVHDPEESFTLTERWVETPYSKDYDVRDQRPFAWDEDFDLSNWGFFFVRIGGDAVGAAAVAFDTPGVDMLEGRRGLAVLWDIRVHPDWRGRGIGRALLSAVEEWSRVRHCRELKIETQNINVGACRFYERQGYALRRANVGAYPELPDEIQLLYYKDLRAA